MLTGIGIGLKKSILKELSAAGLLHDIGKLNLPLDLLEKAGPLSEEEYETMKTHSELGSKRTLTSVPRRKWVFICTMKM